MSTQPVGWGRPGSGVTSGVSCPADWPDARKATEWKRRHEAAITTLTKELDFFAGSREPDLARDEPVGVPGETAQVGEDLSAAGHMKLGVENIEDGTTRSRAECPLGIR